MAESTAPPAVSILDAPIPRVIFGLGALDRVADEAALLGARRVLLVVDPSAAGVGDAIATALGEMLAARIDDVIMHVPAQAADYAVDQAQSAGADLVVSVGGGSATGLAKAIALATGLPILAVPTTYAGSEMTPVWGRTEARNGGPVKRTGRDPRVRPRVVVYDPALTVSLPAGLSAASGLNALAHLLSSLFTPGAAPLVGAVAEEGVRTLAGALPRVVAAPEDLAARSDALYGAWLAGWTLGATTTGVHHKVCHVLGGAYNLPHAQTHAALLPYSTAFLAPYAPAAAARVARAFGGLDPAEAVYDLARRIGAPTSLADVGFERWRIDEVAQQVALAPPPSPRPVDTQSISDLLRAACEGRRPASSLAAAPKTEGPEVEER